MLSSVNKFKIIRTWIEYLYRELNLLLKKKILKECCKLKASITAVLETILDEIYE